MSFFTQRNIEKSVILLSCILLLILGWLFIRGDQSIGEETFIMVNDDMEKLMAQAHETTITPAPSAPSNQELVHTANPTSLPTLITEASPTIAIEVTPSSQVNINTATLEELDALPGIGKSKAQAIVDYRISEGLFTSVDQLLEVRGIGDKLLAKLKPLVQL